MGSSKAQRKTRTGSSKEVPFPFDFYEDILYLVLSRLPPPAVCRLRCVCTQWKRLLSSPAHEESRGSCTVRAASGCGELFCHSEKRWFKLPRGASSSEEVDWTVADVEAGLVLYESYQDDRLCLGLSNPLMNDLQIIPWSCSDLPNFRSGSLCLGGLEGRTHSVENVPASYADAARLEPCRRFGSSHRLKLWVDRQKKSFRIVLLTEEPGLTWVFDSSTGVWAGFNCQPGHIWRSPDHTSCKLDTLDVFCWKGEIFCYGKEMGFDCFLTLCVKEKTWKRTVAEFPGKTPWETLTIRWSTPWYYKVIHSQDQVMLVQFFTGVLVEKGFTVWKLLDNPSSSVHDFSLPRWTKIMTRSGSGMPFENLAYLSVMQMCCGNGFVLALLRGYTEKLFSGRKCQVLTKRCVRYTIATQSWTEIPFPQALMPAWRLHDWQPSLDMESKLGIKGL